MTPYLVALVSPLWMCIACLLRINREPPAVCSNCLSVQRHFSPNLDSCYLLTSLFRGWFPVQIMAAFRAPTSQQHVENSDCFARPTWFIENHGTCRLLRLYEFAVTRFSDSRALTYSQEYKQYYTLENNTLSKLYYHTMYNKLLLKCILVFVCSFLWHLYP